MKTKHYKHREKHKIWKRKVSHFIKEILNSNFELVQIMFKNLAGFGSNSITVAIYIDSFETLHRLSRSKDFLGFWKMI